MRRKTFLRVDLENVLPEIRIMKKNPKKWIQVYRKILVTHMFVPETSFLKPYKFSYICNWANLNLWSINSFFSAGKPAFPSNSELASIFLNKYVRNQIKERKEELRQALRSISLKVFNKIVIWSSKKANLKVLSCTFRCGIWNCEITKRFLLCIFVCIKLLYASRNKNLMLNFNRMPLGFWPTDICPSVG